MVKRFIFDLDGTLLHCDFTKEREYFRSALPKEDAEKFIDKFIYHLYDYEEEYLQYEIKNLSRYLSEKMGFSISEEFIEDWIEANTTCTDTLYDETKDILEYLKNKKYSLVVLTNWFYKTQSARLYNKDILKYFDNVFTGEIYTKPNKESYLNAIGDYNANECVMIGDNIKKDVLMPQSLGITSFYYNPNNKEYDKKLIKSIDSFERIKEMY